LLLRLLVLLRWLLLPLLVLVALTLIHNQSPAFLLPLS
jgi:hypothetical protein